MQEGNLVPLRKVNHYIFLNMLMYYYVLVETKAKLSNVVAVFPESDIWWSFFNFHVLGSKLLEIPKNHCVNCFVQHAS